MAHMGGERSQDDAKSNSDADDAKTNSDTNDATRILVRDESADAEMTQLIHPRSDIDGPEGRGTIIGSARFHKDKQAGVGAPGMAGAAGPKPGETVFIPTGSDAAWDEVGPVVGWLVVLKGPGHGRFCPVYYGQNSIGRAADQRIRLDFGDRRISRQAHAFLIYDDVARKFYIRDGGKTNLVRHNGELVMTPTELRDRDEVAIGETTLLFIALCGPEFDWLTEAGRTGEASEAVADELDH